MDNKHKVRQYTPEQRSKWQKAYFKTHPWAKTLCAISTRCNNKGQPYKKRGIKNYLTTNDLKSLWFRDKAYLLKQPSIDRINGLGNYTLKNCRYIERIENISQKKSLTHSTPRPNLWMAIKQYDLNNNFLKTWESLTKASKKMGISNTSINNCLRKRSRMAGGYIWKYAN